MFKNIPPTDFTIESKRDDLSNELLKLKSIIDKKPISVCPIVEGKEYKTDSIIERIDSNDGQTVLGKIHLADNELALKAMNSLRANQYDWKNTDIEVRAEILRKAASIMDKERHRLSSIIIRESAKTWGEADKDVVEAIDFCNYYAEEAITKLAKFKTDDIPGENNYHFYEPVGTSVVISPWNFPLAIPCGMLTASLVTGNTALLKPAELSSIIAKELVEILFEAGLPKDVLAFLPAKGSEVGPTLVKSEICNVVCFTGSLEVGKQILKNTSNIEEQDHIKKTILELGGKNAIIIDEDADLDEAIKGVLYSAFGYSGQKCSACSRVIIVDTAYDAFIERFIPAASDLIIGESYKPSSYMGPVINEKAKERILNFIEEAKKDNKLLFQGETPEKGNFVPITIFENNDNNNSLFQEEIFGPVLAITKAKNIDTAIMIANNSKYALTGGLYSRSPDNIEKVINNFSVGNIYINRSCTGAIVSRQPFGGFKLSGIGSKAGGPDYLKQFVVPRTVSENTLRRGFTPDEI